MAGYRQFHTQFWKDEWLIDLEPLERYLFSYLFTNDLSSISGIYKLPLRVIVNETGLEKSVVELMLSKFQAAKKIFYQEGVMWVVNMHKYHKNASPRTMAKVNADVREIPDCQVKTAYLYYEKTGIYSMDTVSIPRSESVIVSVNENKSENITGGIGSVPEIGMAEIVDAYQSEIGMITATISEELQEAEKEYSAALIVDAIHEAARQNKRSWKYTLGILKRWKADGKTPRVSSAPHIDPSQYDTVMPDYIRGGK